MTTVLNAPSKFAFEARKGNTRGTPHDLSIVRKKKKKEAVDPLLMTLIVFVVLKLGVHLVVTLLALLMGGFGFGLSVEPIFINREHCV